MGSTLDLQQLEKAVIKPTLLSQKTQPATVYISQV